MTKLTTQGEKDSANTDLPQFYDPDDQVIDLDDETDIRKDPETETVEIDPDEAAVLAYFTNARRDQPARSTPRAHQAGDLQIGREEQTLGTPEPRTRLSDPQRLEEEPRWTTQYGFCSGTSAKSDTHARRTAPLI